MLHLPELDDSELRRRIRALAAADEQDCVAALIGEADAVLGDGTAIAATAAELIEAIRDRQRYRAGVHALLNEYALSSREGVVLMCLAEALLRVPDRITADRLIRDRLASADWGAHVGRSPSLFVNASAWGLLLTGKVMRLGEDDAESAWHMLRRTVSRAGEPAIRAAMRLAMRIMGTQFVLGRDIDEAIAKSAEWGVRGYLHSYDMLGEGARTSAQAHAHFEACSSAIRTIGRHIGTADPRGALGMSLKLTALHPRVDLAQAARLRAELVPRVLELAELAREYNIGLTIDAEEARRLDITLDVFEAVYADARLAGWDGLGLVVQAYLKCAPALIDWLDALAARHGRRIMLRLVKGAYWDAEIKHAQLHGLASYPVFTRKASTDLSYLVCASRLLARRERLYPQFATHNAHSAAAVLALCGAREGFEFQRLHGMGEELFEELIEARGTGVPCRIYAPVGEHAELLAYLVRRLLENGANSSFVHNLADETRDSAALGADPRSALRGLTRYASRRIPLPGALFGPTRSNARGVDTDDPPGLQALARDAAAWRASAARLGSARGVDVVAVVNPADHRELLGHYAPAGAAAIESAAARAHTAAPAWAATPVAARADCLRRTADALEDALAELAGFCVKEAGKTLADAIAEVREAVDFCRYYAAEAERLLGAHPHALAPRGPLLCISPWNFPVAIFTGQVAAALSTGNPVVAKPAEQTTLVALRVAELFHDAGVPHEVLQVLCGPGEPIGARLLPDGRIAGVLFTGSAEVAHHIAKALAARGGARAMLVAETGGQNAMVVDSTALPEQVVDDVIASAFDSAGQRCSALRVLYVQQEIADRLIPLLAGAMNELRVGDPAQLASDIGPIIDHEARARLQAHVARLACRARVLHAGKLSAECDEGSFFAPQLLEIESIEQLPREVFGPVLHLIRYRAEDLEQLPERINATGYGLTFGVHSRIDASMELLAREVSAGNVYVNRSMIGAVVGVQPFGGRGLSGTGPKAGGPLYLGRLLHAANPHPPAWRPLVATEAADIAEAFDWRALLVALREAQRAARRDEPCARIRCARALHEGIAHDPFREHDAREALAHELRQLIAQAEALAAPRELPGPTGETNTLHFEPRGVLACASRAGAAERDLLLPTLAALLAGNAVLLLCDGDTHELARALRELLAGAGFAEALSALRVVPGTAAMRPVLADCALDGVLCHDDPALAQWLSRVLAARPGALLPLIDEGFGPLYAERFVLERTVSVNTAAAGGNAALLSQSESD